MGTNRDISYIDRQIEKSFIELDETYISYLFLDSKTRDKINQFKKDYEHKLNHFSELIDQLKKLKYQIIIKIYMIKFINKN